jgi:phosphoglycolate phosphatase-like HAD superfamily hydrolase
LEGEVAMIFFDFDGTLTATAGGLVKRQSQKVAELVERASFLAPRLSALRDAGILLGIISKSTAFTVRKALEGAGLSEYFTGPIVGQAVGLEGKAGFIEQLAAGGSLPPLTSEEASICRVLLVDDDLFELELARNMGVQTFPAPAEGGLQDEHFAEIFTRLGVHCAQKRALAL